MKELTKKQLIALIEVEKGVVNYSCYDGVYTKTDSYYSKETAHCTTLRLLEKKGLITYKSTEKSWGSINVNGIAVLTDAGNAKLKERE